MRLSELQIKNFGPFVNYNIDFIEEDSCMLLTGKNNEGKTTIINALKLIDSSLKAISNKANRITLNHDTFYLLQKQDIVDLIIGRLVHDYENNVAMITAIFDDDFEVSCFVDPIEDLIYANFIGIIPDDIDKIFGFIPLLGPFNEKEEILTKKSYIRANFRTSLAPKHFRNTLHQIIDEDQLELVKKLIKDTWQDVELAEIEPDFPNNNINVFFRENRMTREVSWAGQGLQIWFQIIVHLVRLKEYLNFTKMCFTKAVNQATLSNSSFVSTFT